MRNPKWRALRDLNAGPTGPEPVALSILGQGPPNWSFEGNPCSYINGLRMLVTKKGAKRYSFNYTEQDGTVVFLECVWTGLNEL